MLLLALAGCSDRADPGEDLGYGNWPADLSPLEEYLGEPEDSQLALSVEEQRQGQELIAGCMKSMGFEYVPEESHIPPVDAAATHGQAAQRTEIAKYGYYVVSGDPNYSPGEELEASPNQVAFDSMTPGEQSAYTTAMWGEGVSVGALEPPIDSPDSTGLPGDTTDGQGCVWLAEDQLLAQAEVPASAPDLTQFDDLLDARQRIYGRILDDFRMVEATHRWTTCLEGKGFPGFLTLTEPVFRVTEMFAPLIEMKVIREENGLSMVPLSDDLNTLPVTPDPQKAAELQEYEISLALADFDCKVAYNAEYEQVRIAFEFEFIDEHREELERYRSVVNGA